jgi:PAS domain S-box-containing protein
MVLIPLVSENEIYGMLEIARAVQTSDEELNRFKVIAGQMTQAIGRKLAEEKVIDERNNATKYFETAGIILMILDKTGKVLKINKKGCDVLQYAVSEIVGKDWFEFIPANIAREVRSTFGQLMKGEIKEVEFYENPVVTRNGEERLIEWHNVILRDTEGKPVGTLSSGEDITAKKQNEKFLLAQRNLGISTSALTDLDELFRVSMESLLNVSGMECGMIYLFDEELKKLDMVFSKGLSEQFVLATSQYDEHSGNVKFVKSGNAAFVYYNELPVESGEIERAEKLVSVAMLPIVNKGTVIGCINLASHQDIPMPDSFQKGIEVIVTLISNAMVRISIEDEIRDLNASLEIKIKERTGQLALAKTEADRANVAKSEFLSRMSHELRTPMNSILGFAQLLNRSETNPESTKRIKQIIDSGKHLLDLINEVLDLAKIESGRLSLSLESVQLSGIITETLEIVSHLLKRER